ncbi:Ring-h2 finger protein atl8 [Thalictrum thalictroides]|uniref:Ring-h2 finger protein atl8 n=1 Tax=Thalictrum thalictroides TaxID=46969 RepID=A0A7J6W417_THATH|nr:Ring-h2 finger protein atl8 [Thalictrum thalictroides]
MSAPTTGKNSSVVAVAPPPEPISLDSDFVVILAALLCALICVVGLVAVARCAWLRRYTSGAAANRSRQQASANKGLRKKILRSLPKMVFNGEVNVNGKLVDCAICLTEFMEGDEIRILPQCGHGFHVGCIDTWLGSHSSCPSCRQILVVTRCKKCGGVPETSVVLLHLFLQLLLVVLAVLELLIIIILKLNSKLEKICMLIDFYPKHST